MPNNFDIILRLTSSSLGNQDLVRLFKDFAIMMGWEPSDHLFPEEGLLDVINGHLIVDHGLEQSAVITFLKSPISSLNPEQTKKILSISYNNLIDWHIYVESSQASFVFNRSYNPNIITKQISNVDFEALRSTMFEQITGASRNPNFPALDNALIENISYWKRHLGAELNNKPTRYNYSTLFNGIIFVRAAEDLASRVSGSKTRILLSPFERRSDKAKQSTLSQVIKKSLAGIIEGKLLKSFLDIDQLSVFDNLPSDICYDLVSSFYKGRAIPYLYDFAIMSKHALSRIYEHYVSLLRFEQDYGQLSFIPALPIEQHEKTFGSVYTPQFIARFFAKYLYLQFPPSIFKNTKILDPACGSGIFLRTVLEYKCTPGIEGISSEEIEMAFSNASGFDIDENASQASKLSLALLYLVLIGGNLPKNLDVKPLDTLEYVSRKKKLKQKYDIVIANPPFVSFDTQSIATRKNVKSILGTQAEMKPDTYLSFLKIAIDSLNPGGFGLFVLPHSFLNKKGDDGIRKYIHEQCWIRCIIDLSLIPVFKEKGTYVILLIFQKKIEEVRLLTDGPKATIVVCNDLVGHALQDLLSGKRTENNFYSIYDVHQSSFSKNEWSNLLLPPSQFSIQEKIDKFKPVSDFLEVKQGIVTGFDDMFVVRKIEIPAGEEKIWRPLLRDRDMLRYSIPNRTDSYVFYPIIENHKLNGEEIRDDFPLTWRLLGKAKNKIKSNTNEWWMPHRLRDPQKLFIPKLVTPHLVLIPRFSLDQKGKYAITRSPYLIARNPDADLVFLKVFLAILNSTIGAWLISLHSDKYSHGYARLEVNTLKSIPVPDPSQIDKAVLNKILNCVDHLMEKPDDKKIYIDLDLLIATVYGLNTDEQLSIGFQGAYVQN